MADVPIKWLAADEDILDEDKLTLRDDGQQWCRHDLAPGSAQWSLNTKDEIVGLCFICPCGCGSIGDLSIVAGYGGPTWTFDGDYEKPTLKPSIQKTSPCRWHGYLTSGVFQSL